jgi:adenosylcobinamide kinase/adenosylcobinamide-phosphate guanylyltransferase
VIGEMNFNFKEIKIDSNSNLILVTGGARSGKSCFAERLVAEIGQNIAYIATAIPFDEGMRDRIKKHRESRPSEWTTYEAYRDVYKSITDIARNHDTMLLDCITIMVTNLMFENGDIDWEKITREEIDEIEEMIRKQIELLIENIKKNNLNAVLVTNEIGMGLVPENRLARIFRDIAGRINQLIAREADFVYLTVSGIPIKIK